MRGYLRSAITASCCLFPQIAFAAAVGDTFYISNGVERTITKIILDDGEFVELTAQILKANAAESCENSMMLKPNTNEMNKCINKTIGKPERYKITCGKPAITTGGITYRPSRPNGDTTDPWFATNKKNLMIKGENLFEKACFLP